MPSSSNRIAAQRSPAVKPLIELGVGDCDAESDAERDELPDGVGVCEADGVWESLALCDCDCDAEDEGVAS